MTRPKPLRLPGARRILHATDFSRASRPAFRAALEAARDGPARLVLVHVLTAVTLIPDLYTVSSTTFAAFQRSIRAGAQKRLDRLVGLARARGVRAEGLLLQGIPQDQILRAAQLCRADLIVMGTHGRTGFEKALLGSVAERVVSLARCPVLTVRAGRS